MGIITSVLIGIIAGWIAEKVMNSSGGLFTNLIVGVLGGIIGRWVAGLLSLDYIGTDFVDQLVVSACGAVILLAVWRTVMGRKKA
ncbi:GlsB/YeaQ/YmgE family stress response membrane protein [Xanthobacter sp. TB0139]|uniref:GlsB/YeaQ/YmgE family stress response membrane protein n=1 Tax=Xanthobacter sp. TB0139 TaxID=3459178 RepID=UPI0040393D3D